MHPYEKRWWECQSQRQADKRATAAAIIVISVVGMAVTIVAALLW